MASRLPGTTSHLASRDDDARWRVIITRLQRKVNRFLQFALASCMDPVPNWPLLPLPQAYILGRHLEAIDLELYSTVST